MHHYADQFSPPCTVSGGFSNDQFYLPPSKRRRLSVLDPPSSKNMSDKPGKVSNMTSSDVIPAKSRRVRTGCLTCRERHLKCDEGTPDCLNCRKSNRECKRGVRLNFIDMTCKEPPYIPATEEWTGMFKFHYMGSEGVPWEADSEYSSFSRRIAPYCVGI